MYYYGVEVLHASPYNAAAARSSGSQFVTLKLGSSFPYLLHVSSVAYEVPKRATCNSCGVKRGNTYEAIWRGNSGVAMDGAKVMPAKTTPQP